MPRGLIAAVFLCGLAGCVDGSVTGVLAVQSSTANDGTVTPDGESPDATPSDASTPTTDGGFVDAGVTIDAGFADAGVLVDTGPPPPPPTFCGDGTCDTDESCSDCTADCGACGPDPQWAALEAEALTLINDRRAQGATCGGTEYGPRGPLLMDSALQKAARDHSADMATNDYFSHTSQDGRTAFTRMLQAGYTGQPISENIAAGQSSPSGVVTSWMGSSGHCSNIMSSNSNEIGVGYAYGPGTEWRHYWTLTFGRR